MRGSNSKPTPANWPSGLGCSGTDPCFEVFGAGDTDNDGVLNYQDNCSLVGNYDQLDSNGVDDGDGIGDACEPWGGPSGLRCAGSVPCP